MRKSVKIFIKGILDHTKFGPILMEQANNLGVLGCLKKDQDNKYVIYAVGARDSVESLIDQLYDQDNGILIEDLDIRPLAEDQDFHGIFRVVNGEE